jgi:dephospho-CoA kinase
VDRRVVGRIVFANREALQQLEQLTHPRVKARRAALREKLMADPAVKAIVEDSPLLLETGLAEQCDVLVFVEADRETRLQRVAESRGWTEEDLDRREKNQASLDIKRRQANYMVNNHADRDEVLEQVRGVLSRILQPDEH